MLEQHLTTLRIATRGRGLVEITADVRAWLAQTGIDRGLLTLFVRHTSASLLVQENADADVRADLERFFARLVRDGDPLFRHRTEGPDDMPAHVRSALTATQLAVRGVEEADSGLASGLVNTAQQIGGALGLAVLGGIASAQTAAMVAAGSGQAEATAGGFLLLFLGVAVLAAIGAAVTALVRSR